MTVKTFVVKTDEDYNQFLKYLSSYSIEDLVVCEIYNKEDLSAYNLNAKPRYANSVLIKGVNNPEIDFSFSLTIKGNLYIHDVSLIIRGEYTINKYSRVDCTLINMYNSGYKLSEINDTLEPLVHEQPCLVLKNVDFFVENLKPTHTYKFNNFSKTILENINVITYGDFTDIMSRPDINFEKCDMMICNRCTLINSKIILSGISVVDSVNLIDSYLTVDRTQSSITNVIGDGLISPAMLSTVSNIVITSMRLTSISGQPYATNFNTSIIDNMDFQHMISKNILNGLVIDKVKFGHYQYVPKFTDCIINNVDGDIELQPNQTYNCIVKGVIQSYE